MADTKTEEQLYMERVFNRINGKGKASELMRELHHLPVIPSYHSAENDKWSVTVRDTVAFAKGYFGQIFSGPDVRFIARDDDSVWMSLTGMELESFAFHLNNLVEVAESAQKAGRRPRIGIGGLGLGMALISALHALTREYIECEVIVIEKCPNVRQVFEESLVDLSRDFYEDVRDGFWGIDLQLVEGDILAMDPIVGLDFLYVDIWLGLGTKEAYTDSQIITKRWQPKKYGYWGQEIDVADRGREIIEELCLAERYKDERKGIYIDAYEATCELPLPLSVID